MARTSLGLLLALAVPAAALACRCVPMTPAAAARAADMVVLADVVQAMPERPHYGEFRLRVARSWKGKASGPLTVRSRRTDCMADLAVGQRYLIYLRRKDGALETSMCAGNLPAGQAAAAIAVLDRRG